MRVLETANMSEAHLEVMTLFTSVHNPLLAKIKTPT